MFSIKQMLIILLWKCLWITCVFHDEIMFTYGHRPGPARLLQGRKKNAGEECKIKPWNALYSSGYFTRIHALFDGPR